MWVAILIFLLSKNRLRHRKKLQRALARRWLHTQSPAAQWASSAGRSANVPPAFQKRAWAGSLAFSSQSPPRDCLTEGSSRWRTASRVSFASKTRSDAAASCSTRSVSARSQKSLGCEAHAGALALGKSPGLPWDFQRSFALPKQRLQAQELATLSIGAHPKFHMLVWLVILFCLRLKKGWSEHAKLLEPRRRLCVLRRAGSDY